MERRRFKNLDGLRFIAATTVALSHLETLKQYRGIPFIKNRFFEHSADISVTFFFVLSGFLIMWWFLEETDGNTVKINIYEFYVNRISRTWPLYFSILFISVVISAVNGNLNHDALAVKRYFAYLLLLPNTADVLFNKDIYMGPAWSLAVEEFFYFTFPILLLRTKKENLKKVLFRFSLFFLIISTLLNPVFLNIIALKSNLKSNINYLVIFFERYRLYSFCAGSFIAVAIYNDNKKHNYKNYNFYSLIICLVTVLFFFSGTTFSFLTNQLYALLFSVLIYLLSISENNNLLLNNKFIITSGKISYGIYMLHMFLIMRLINQGAFLLRFKYTLISTLFSWVLLLLTLMPLAFISYKYFENPIRTFIRRKFIYKKGKSRI